MERQTILANRIDLIGDMATYDKACKNVLANKIILAWLLKYCLKEYADQDINDIALKYIEGIPDISNMAVHANETAGFIEGTNTESSALTEATVTFDIKFNAIIPHAAENAEMVIDVEAQSDFHPGYPIIKRGVYYSGRMISMQYGTVFDHSHYEKLKKAVSIWICPYPPEYRKNTILYYHLTEKALHGNIKESNSNYDLISIIMICPGEPDSEKENPLLRMLSVLLSPNMNVEKKKKLLSMEFGIPMTEKLESEVTHMCNLSIGVFEAGYQDGFNMGFNDGFSDGFSDGFDNAIISSIRNMTLNKGWDIETCMSILNVPKEKQDKYKHIIEETPNNA